MATDLTTTDAADGQPSPAWRALSLHPSTTSFLAEQLGNDAPACIDAAIAKIEHDLRPVPVEAKARGQWSVALDERVRRLAVKVLPTAKPADTAEWRKTMVDALADLPAMISLTAAKRAIHCPFRFIGEIEVAVREIAAELVAERDQRLAAFRRHRDQIKRALNPSPALPAPAAEQAEEWNAEKAHRLNSSMRRMGLSSRWAADGTMFQADTAAEIGAAA